MTDLHLMIPGPVEADDDVLAAIGEQTLPHYGPAFMTLFNETTDLLKKLFGTRGDAIMMPGPGSAALDAAIASLVPRGESMVVIDNGFFGMRTTQMVKANGIRPRVFKADWGQPVDPDKLREELAGWIAQADRENAPIRALAVVHHETSTGVLNPLEAIAKVVHEFDLPLIVDAVASFGGVPLPVDEWGIDVCVSVPNKCLGVPPGIALVSVSERAWKLAEANSEPHGWYLNLNTWRWYMDNWADWHPYPTTMPTNNIVAVNAGLKGIFAGGVEAHYAEFAEAARLTREGLGPLGFALFPDPAFASPIISALTLPPGLDDDALRSTLFEEGYMISGGLGDLHGKIIRVGHMGKAKDPAVVQGLVEAVGKFVHEQAPA